MRRVSSNEVSLFEAAAEYAQRGWPVLPLKPHGKTPLIKTGLLGASVLFDTIRMWWERWPNANIGLRTGVRFDVLDIDGDAGRASLAAKVGPGVVAPGPASRTGGGGEHWLFLPSGTANRAGLLPKVDWRGTNGYIVAPPSIHSSGSRYEWIEGHGPDDILWPPNYIGEWLPPLLAKWEDPDKYERVKTTNPFGLNIVDVAQAMGLHPRRDGGGRYAVECPFHDGDREPSMKLYPDNSFHCFGCGAWGDVLNLHRGNPRYKYGQP